LETAVGVFTQRERAEEAVKNLLERKVPEGSLVFLTRSESEAKSMGKQLGLFAGSFVGGAAGLSAGVAAATLLAVPGVGQVFALGIGAAALFGLVGAGSGAAIGSGVGHQEGAPQPTSGTGSQEDLAFYNKVLNEGHSLVVVRSDSPEIAAIACEVLDSLALSMEKGAATGSAAATRSLDGAVAIDFQGKITLGAGTALLRNTIGSLLEKGSKRILLNLREVDMIDSAGLGELARTYATIRSRGGKFKLVAPTKNAQELFRITKMERVFEIEPDESSALKSLREDSSSASSAG
jgi:anti-sigma B factor antagonist